MATEAVGLVVVEAEDRFVVPLLPVLEAAAKATTALASAPTTVSTASLTGLPSFKTTSLGTPGGRSSQTRGVRRIRSPSASTRQTLPNFATLS